MLRRSLITLLCILAFQTLSIGQTFRGALAGSVSDASGAGVPGAEVKITNKDNGLTRSQASSSSGEFSFADLPAGIYTVSVTKTGFQETKQDIEVAVAKTSSLAMTIGVASQTQTVEVQAAAATLETSDTALNAVVDSKAVQEIPLNGRDFTQLLRLTPGYNDTGSTNGARANQNNWQIDGADNNDFWHNINAVNRAAFQAWQAFCCQSMQSTSSINRLRAAQIPDAIRVRA